MGDKMRRNSTECDVRRRVATSYYKLRLVRLQRAHIINLFRDLCVYDLHIELDESIMRWRSDTVRQRDKSAVAELNGMSSGEEQIKSGY